MKEAISQDQYRHGLTPGKIFPESEEQRCWNHRIFNALDALPTPQPRRGASGHLPQLLGVVSHLVSDLGGPV